MTFSFGFRAEKTPTQPGPVPRRSLVEVYFPSRKMTLTYYNDQFDLKRGDTVYVDGKLEGHRGHVVSVKYAFKIKVSDYKRVIAVIDTNVSGRLYFAGSHLVSFDHFCLNPSKVLSWYKAPVDEEDEEEYIVGDEESPPLLLDKLVDMDVSISVAERGRNYFAENRVRYICIDGERGFAIVEGTKPYEVEFDFRDGKIRNLVCPCYCNYHCKHEVAAMLQLKETLEIIQKHYSSEFENSGFFAAIHRETLFSFALAGKESGSIVL